MEKWKIKAFGFAFGKDSHNDWFTKKFQSNGSLKRAVHSHNLFSLFKVWFFGM